MRVQFAGIHEGWRRIGQSQAIQTRGMRMESIMADACGGSAEGREVDSFNLVNPFPRAAGPSAFQSLNPNGAWTLDVENTLSGGEARLVQWGLPFDSSPSLARAINAMMAERVGHVQALAVTLVSGPPGLVVTNGLLAWTPTEAQGPSTNSLVVVGCQLEVATSLVNPRWVRYPGMVTTANGRSSVRLEPGEGEAWYRLAR